MDIAVCTLYTPDLEYWYRDAAGGLLDYAAIHSYAGYVQRDILDKSKRPHYSKIVMLLRLLHDHEWVCWFDADMVIMEHDRKLEPYLDGSLIDLDYEIIFDQARRGSETILNTGCIFARRTDRTVRFLKHVLRAEDNGHKWAENQTVIDLLPSHESLRWITYPLARFHRRHTDGSYALGDFLVHCAGNTHCWTKAMSRRSLLEIPQRSAFSQLFSRLGYQTGAEIGVKAGDFSRQLARFWPGKLLLVDTWKEMDHPLYKLINHQKAYDGVLDQFLCRRNASIMIMPSLEAAMRIDDNSLDWVYIDADHRAKPFEQDLEAWSPKVRRGGIVAGHDYLNDSSQYIEVKEIADKWAKYQGVHLRTTSENNPSWYYVKR